MSPTSPPSGYGFSSSLVLLAVSIISFLDLPAEWEVYKFEAIFDSKMSKSR
jgi:hypothetical protein